MEPEKQSSKIDPRLWPLLAALTVLVHAAAAWLERSNTSPAPTASRSIEAETKAVVEEAAKQVAERPTTDPLELQVRTLRAEVEKCNARTDLHAGIFAVMWPEQYQEVLRRVELEARVRQPKNARAGPDARTVFKKTTRHWSAVPATPAALVSLKDEKTPLHEAGDDALTSIKVPVDR